MANASDYLEGQIGTHLLRTGSWTKPTAIYVALFTTLPAEDGTGGVEVSGGAYARVEHGPGDAYWSEPTLGSGRFANIGDITFPEPSGANWGTIVGYGLMDDETAGNYLIGKLFAASFAVNNGDPAPVFSEGTLRVTIG